METEGGVLLVSRWSEYFRISAEVEQIKAKKKKMILKLITRKHGFIYLHGNALFFISVGENTSEI